MKRKLMASLVLVIILIVSATPVFASQSVKVFIDDTQVAFDVQPTIINGRTMVPLGSILNTLGLKYQWYGEDQMIYVLNQNNMCYELTINDPNMEVYEVLKDSSNVIKNMVQLLGPHEYKVLDTSPIAINGRTMVPIRVISEIAGYDVSWDNINGIVIIHTGSSYYTPPVVEPTYDSTNTNIAVDGQNMQLLVGDIVYDYAELDGVDYMVYAKIVSIDTNNNIQLQWFDIAKFNWFEHEIPYLSYFTNNPTDFSLLQRANNIDFYSLQWRAANEVYLQY